MEKNTKVIIGIVIFLIAILLLVMYLSSPKSDNHINNDKINVSVGFLEPLGSGNIEIVEFSDFQCPFCKKAEPTIKKIVSEYGEEVVFYYRNFPLESHENSFEAALAGYCANEQDKFWQYHDLLFESQDKLDKDSLKNYASELELNIESFNLCLDEEKYKNEVERDINDAEKAGVTGTPTFFINGRKVVGAQSFEVFDDIIKEEASNFI